MAILKSAFNAHPRTVTLINAYSEGGHQQMLQKMTHLFESLPPFLEIFPAEFFDDPELSFVETDACSFVFDQPGTLGDEIDSSSSDEDSDERH